MKKTPRHNGPVTRRKKKSGDGERIWRPAGTAIIFITIVVALFALVISRWMDVL